MGEILAGANNGLTNKVLLVTVGILVGVITEAVINNVMLGDKLDTLIRVEERVKDLTRRVDIIETRLEKTNAP